MENLVKLYKLPAFLETGIASYRRCHMTKFLSLFNWPIYMYSIWVYLPIAV